MQFKLSKIIVGKYATRISFILETKHGLYIYPY